MDIEKNDKGLRKISWKDIRNKISGIESTFTKIVDELDPDSSFPLYLAYYPYGAKDADTESSFFPKSDGTFYRLSSNETPKDVLKHLGYSINSTPLGMILDKEVECFIDLKSENITIPWLIYKPGDIFPLARIFNKKTDRIYAPNGLLSSTAGARSTFMLPNIGSAINHSNLQRDFNVQNPTPKSLYEHWFIFKEIVNSDVIACDWLCCIMYFSEKWLTKIHYDKAWSGLKQYLHELAWYRFEYEKNRIYYDITFSMLQKKRNLKPNPYLSDTAKHLFATALGATPGYIPAQNNNALPMAHLQKAFVDSYGLKKYLPTIMQPYHFKFESDILPVYYSLQHPSTHVFSPKSREMSSTLFEMRELEHIIRVFTEELSKNNEICSDTILSKIAKLTKFNYFHNKIDRHRIVKSSSEMLKLDDRFHAHTHQYKSQEARFASDAPFVRGCISILTKN